METVAAIFRLRNKRKPVANSIGAVAPTMVILIGVLLASVAVISAESGGRDAAPTLLASPTSRQGEKPKAKMEAFIIIKVEGRAEMKNKDDKNWRKAEKGNIDENCVIRTGKDGIVELECTDATYKIKPYSKICVRDIIADNKEGVEPYIKNIFNELNVKRAKTPAGDTLVIGKRGDREDKAEINRVKWEIDEDMESDVYSYNGIEWLYENKKYSAVIRNVGDFMSDFPDSLNRERVELVLAKALYREGRKDEAETIFRKLLSETKNKEIKVEIEKGKWRIADSPKTPIGVKNTLSVLTDTPLQEGNVDDGRDARPTMEDKK